MESTTRRISVVYDSMVELNVKNAYLKFLLVTLSPLLFDVPGALMVLSCASRGKGLQKYQPREWISCTEGDV